MSSITLGTAVSAMRMPSLPLAPRKSPRAATDFRSSHMTTFSLRSCGPPRPDIMALPCVRRARGEAVSDAEVTEAHAEEDENRESQEDGAIAGAVAPFVGSRFPMSAHSARCRRGRPQAACSILIQGWRRLFCATGDAGVEHALVIDDEEGGDAQHERSHRGGVQADDHRAFVSSLTPPAIDQCDLHDRAAESHHSWSSTRTHAFVSTRRRWRFFSKQRRPPPTFRGEHGS